MKHGLLFAATVLATLPACAQVPKAFDLAKVWDQNWCLDKGRIIDSTNSPVSREILKDPRASVPVLISQITDRRNTHKEVICYWGPQTVGDLAFILFVELFDDQGGHAPPLELSWNALVGGDGSISAYAIYVKKHGMRGLQTRARRAWLLNRDKLRWNEKQARFELK